MTTLRPYQAEEVEAVRRSLGTKHLAPLLVSPTGSGKTVVAKEIIDRAVKKGTNVLFLAPRRELIFQLCERLAHAGISHGLILAGERRTPEHPVQVASVQTLIRRNGALLSLLNPGLVIVDEAHIGVGGETQKLIQSFACPRIGLTATPSRADGRGLGVLYDDMVMGPRVAELTRLGFLVPVRYFAPSCPDLKGVKVIAGDYNQKQLEERVNKPTLVGDIVTNWARIAPTRRTLVFTVSVAHSLAVCQAFTEAGIKAEHIDGDTSHDNRTAIVKRFRGGETQVVTNCELFTYGVDIPEITCGVLAKPTRSIARFLQMAGRLLRPCEGKVDTILIDHAGAVDDIGFVDDEFEWTLDGNRKVRKAKDAKTAVHKPVTCSECKFVYDPAPRCPNCGHVPVRQPKAVETVDDDLVELTKTKARLNRQWSDHDKRKFYGELRFVEAERGYKYGWAANQYRTRLGVFPNAFKDAPAVEPSLETRSWVKSRWIAYAKAQQKRAERP